MGSVQMLRVEGVHIRAGTNYSILVSTDCKCAALYCWFFQVHHVRHGHHSGHCAPQYPQAAPVPAALKQVREHMLSLIHRVQ